MEEEGIWIHVLWVKVVILPEKAIDSVKNMTQLLLVHMRKQIDYRDLQGS